MNKIAIITSLVGNCDLLNDPSIIYDNADYFAFVDVENYSGLWNIRKPYQFSKIDRFSNRRNAKIFKILPQLFLPKYDYFFWVDVTHDVLVNPQEIIDEYLVENDMAVFNHRERDCVYNEANAIRKAKKDDDYLLDIHLEFLRDEKMPYEYGLFELPAFVRKNNDRMTEMSLCWWEQICAFCSRDQLSLPYVFWKLNIKPSIMPGLVNGWNARHLQSKLITQVRPKGV